MWGWASGVGHWEGWGTGRRSYTYTHINTCWRYHDYGGNQVENSRMTIIIIILACPSISLAKWMTKCRAIYLIGRKPIYPTDFPQITVLQ